jgi:hypothetical protein
MSNVPPVPTAPQASPTAKPTEPKEGRYKAKAETPDPVGAPHEFGRSSKGTPELLVHLFVPDLQRTFVSPLYFSADAAPYSEERLRALGCANVTTLAGIDTNEVDVELKYEFYDGKWRIRVSILSGGGVFHTSNPMPGGGKEFAASIQAQLGRPINLGGAAGANGTSASGVPKAPF